MRRFLVDDERGFPARSFTVREVKRVSDAGYQVTLVKAGFASRDDAIKHVRKLRGQLLPEGWTSGG